MKKVIYLLLLTFCCSNFIFAQSNSLADKIVANTPKLPYTPTDSKCTTMDALEYRLANDSEYAKFHNDAMSMAESSSPSSIPCDGTNSIVVPVAFHFAPGVVTCGDADCLLAEIQDQLDAMNVAFGSNTGSAAEAVCPAAYQDAMGNSVASTGTCISFCLAIPPEGNAQGLDPACDPPITIGEFTGGFGAGGGGAPGWGGIMNLFIVSNANCLGVADGIPGAGTSDGVSTCASAFGGTGGSAGCGLDTDGTYNLGATMIHEIGHYLGLFHTHVDGPPSCTDNDVNAPGPFNVNDTPIMANQFYGCPTGCVTNTSQGTGGACGATNVPTANFMAYTDDGCMSMFTEDQAAVMNYWANQLFGGSDSQCSTPSPTELTSACLMEPCVLVCPVMVMTPYSGMEEICAVSGDYTLPTDFSSVVLDDDSDAVYIWSTGNYLSAGGTAAGATYTPAPTTCAPEEVTLYLNVDCGTTPLMPTLDAGTLVLTVYPDPASFVVTDLVTFTDGACDGPTFVVVAGCEAHVTVAPAAGSPTFPVAAGDAGTVTYDVTLNYPVACCCPATMATQTETNVAIVDIPDNAPATPGCTTVTIPAGGSITDVTIDLGIDHTWVGDMVITLTSPTGTTITLGDQPGVPTGNFGCNGDNIAVTFDDAAANTATDFDNACANAPAIAGSYQPIDPLSTFDGEDAAGVWEVCVTDNANGDTGSITSFGVTVETLDPCTDPAGCMLTGTAAYTCAGVVTYCDNICFAEYEPNPGADDMPDATLCVTALTCADVASIDPSCIMTQGCDDGDPCTTGEEETVIVETGEVCGDCGLNSMVVTPACGDPAATNYDMTATCINNTLCTFGEYCDNICFAEYAPSPGPNDTPNAMLCITPLGCADVASIDPTCITTQACDDSDPCTANEEVTVILADGTLCSDCGLNSTTVAAACGDPAADNYDATATCINNALCTYPPACNIAILISQVACDGGGTPDDADDDTVTFNYTVVDNGGTGTTWTDGTLTGQTYGTAIPVGPLMADGSTWTITVNDETNTTCTATNALTLNNCTTADNVPTVGEWGLIILGLMMSIVAIIGIRERKTKEIYS